MSAVKFEGFEVRKIIFENNMSGNVDLDFKFSYGVRYIEEVSKCIGSLTINIIDKENNGIFNLEVVIEGIYSYDKSNEKELIHKETLKELYPYARTLITNLTANAGLSPLVLPMIDADSMEVVEGQPQ